MRTPKGQGQQAIDRIGERLGLSDQPRAVVFHVKGGREHCHVVWSRIDTDQMKAVHLSHDRQKLRAVARELAAEFGHELPHGMRADRGAERFDGKEGLSAAELSQADRSGLSSDDRRKEITSAWREARDAQGFIDGLWERGYHLARGDQRGFVVVDRSGNVHSLSRQVIGAKAKDIREFLDPLSPNDLPGVKETRKRIADQLESEALDDVAGPHLRRSAEELRERQAQRRAVSEAQWQKVELKQRQERMALHTAQKQERDKPFARAALFVFGLLDRVSVLKKVLRPLYENPSLNIEERHKQENDLLDRRFARERQVIERRLKALDRVEARENKSMARDQRRLDAALERAQGRAVDGFEQAAGRDAVKDEGVKPDGKPGPKKGRPKGYRFEP